MMVVSVCNSKFVEKGMWEYLIVVWFFEDVDVGHGMYVLAYKEFKL